MINFILRILLSHGKRPIALFPAPPSHITQPRLQIPNMGLIPGKQASTKFLSLKKRCSQSAVRPFALCKRSNAVPVAQGVTEIHLPNRFPNMGKVFSSSWKCCTARKPVQAVALPCRSSSWALPGGKGSPAGSGHAELQTGGKK